MRGERPALPLRADQDVKEGLPLAPLLIESRQSNKCTKSAQPLNKRRLALLYKCTSLGKAKKRSNCFARSQNNILEKVNKYRHFVPASQEWYNSIYTYNKNYPKTIPVADILLMKLFKCYFNYGIRLKFKPVFSHLQSYLKEGLLLAHGLRPQPQQKKGSKACNRQAGGKGLPQLLLSKSGGALLYGKPATNKSFLGAFSSAKEIATARQEEPCFLRNSLSNASNLRQGHKREKGSGAAQLSNLYRTALASSSYSKKALKEGASPLPMRYRLLSSKKAFLGKGDLKHTNNKVIITFYLYNANQMFISSNFNDRVKALLLPNKSLKIRQGSEESKAVLATASARQQQPKREGRGGLALAS